MKRQWRAQVGEGEIRAERDEHFIAHAVDVENEP